MAVKRILGQLCAANRIAIAGGETTVTRHCQISSFHSRGLALIPLEILLLSTLCFSQLPSNDKQVPRRINGSLGETNLVALKGHMRPDTNASNDLGQVEPTTVMHDMTVWFRPSSAQVASLDQLLRDQHDPQSVRYHKWLSGSDFGSMFGLNQEDIEQIADWLRQGWEQMPPSLRTASP